LYLDAGDAPAAASLLERLLRVDRHDFVGRFQLAQAYEALGRHADADEQRRLGQQTENDLTELTKLNQQAMYNPWDATVRERLAELYTKLDRPGVAAMWIRAAAASRLNKTPPKPAAKHEPPATARSGS
jgi:tetratricopeptide (TPR) repeat protein